MARFMSVAGFIMKRLYHESYISPLYHWYKVFDKRSFYFTTAMLLY